MNRRAKRQGAIAWACLVALFWGGEVAVADDLTTAREAHRSCREQLDAGRPCEALATCRRGLKARPLAALQDLSRQAQSACKAARARIAARAQCADGMARTKDTQNQCCWPGQIWLEGRCVGTPTSCPEGFSADARQAACTPQRPACPSDPGRYVVDEAGHCCWPGQGWSATQQRCVGAPVCPTFFEARDAACIPSDRDGDGVEDRREVLSACIEQEEDIDGFKDDDGCPDIDNDQDGVCDRATDANLADVFGGGCIGHDRCDGQVEDIDGFEDDDGCPDPDNDQDGIPDGLDRCPLEAEDLDRFEDDDGCPEAGTYTAHADLTPWAYGSLGVGGAALVAALSMNLYAEHLRDEVRDARRTDGNIDSITQVQARANETQANDLSLGAAISYSAGGLLVGAGALLYMLNAHEEPPSDASSTITPTLGVHPEGGASVALEVTF